MLDRYRQPVFELIRLCGGLFKYGILGQMSTNDLSDEYNEYTRSIPHS